VTASSFQPLNSRQLDLQRRLRIARECQETSLVAQLEMQWVHRYGVKSLPRPTQEVRQDCILAPQPENHRPSVQELSVISEQSMESNSSSLTPLRAEDLADKDTVMHDCSNPANQEELAVAPPPLAAGPKRFRRWLVAVPEDQNLKAS